MRKNQYGPLTAAQLQLARKMVAAEDARGMSDNAYKLMARVQPDMMRFHRFKKEMLTQNKYLRRYRSSSRRSQATS